MLRSAGRRRRTRRVLAAVVALVLLGWTIAVWRVLGHPRVDEPTTADAVLVLGPVDADGTLELGASLVESGRAATLLLSVVPGRQRGPAGRLCSGRSRLARGTVSCFVPEPMTTRGEARTLAGLAARHGWRTVIVVTSSYHVARSRYVIERCFGGRLELVTPRVQVPARQWVFQAVYQTGAFAKAALESGC